MYVKKKKKNGPKALAKLSGGKLAGIVASLGSGCLRAGERRSRAT